MKKKPIGRFLLKFIGVISFIIVSFCALFLAYGYKADLSLRNIQKTSIIDLLARYKNARIYLNNELQATELPYQIKGILPGSYELSIQKLRYRPWQRQLEVRDNFVTKVHDILLVPEVLDPFIKVVNTFVSDAQFFTGRYGFIVVSAGQSFGRVVTFLPDGTPKQADLTFQSEAINSVDFFSPEGLLVHFENNLHQAFDLSTGQNFVFELSQNIENLQLDYENQVAYFKLQNMLYRVPFAVLPTFTEALDKASYVLLKDIEQYALASKNIYFLRKGQIFIADIFGTRIHPFNLNKTYTNLAFKQGKDFGFLILRANEQRYLYAFAPDESFYLLTPSLVGDYFIDAQDRVLFSNARREIFYFDPESRKTIFVERQAEDFNLVGWYGGNSHFLFTKKEELYLADIHFSNVYELFSKDIGELFLQQDAFYFLDDHNLKTLSFETLN